MGNGRLNHASGGLENVTLRRDW